MKKSYGMTGASFFCGAMLAAMQAAAADPSPKLDWDTRTVGRMMAQVELAIEKKDVKLYCDATVGNTDYLMTSAGACLERVEEKKGKLEDCRLPKIQEKVKKERSECLAMTAEQFAKRTSNFASGRDKWIATVKKLYGVDAAKVIQDEKSILR